MRTLRHDVRYGLRMLRKNPGFTTTAVLIPYSYDEARADRDLRRCTAIGRLRDGVSFREAQAELDTIGRRLAQEYPKENAGWQWVARPLRSEYCGEAGRVLYLLLGASGLLLVVACGNVADLLLIRGLQRQREVAVRTTLGAGRLRMLRQLAVEGLLLAVLGLFTGVVISLCGLALLRPLILSYVPVVGGVKVDMTALMFAGVVALATGAAFGLIPAFQAWRIDLASAFRSDSTHTTSGRQIRRVHSLLAASQIALAFVLVVGAGLAVRTFSNLLRIDPGFDPHNVLTMEIDFQRGNYDIHRVDAFHDEFLNRVRHMPGVTAAATSDGLPLTDQGHHFVFDIEGDRTPVQDGYDSYSPWVSADYFRTLGVRLLAGRDFSETDRLDSNRLVVIVNRALAQRLWPSQNPVGQRLRRRGGDDVYEVIGVVENECYRDAQLTGRMDISPRSYFNRYSSGYANVTVRHGSQAGGHPPDRSETGCNGCSTGHGRRAGRRRCPCTGRRQLRLRRDSTGPLDSCRRRAASGSRVDGSLLVAGPPGSPNRSHGGAAA